MSIKTTCLAWRRSLAAIQDGLDATEMLAERDAKIADLEALIAARNATFADLRTTVRLRDQTIREQRDAWITLQQALVCVRGELARATQPPADATVRERVLVMEVAQLKRNLHTMEDRLAAAEGRPVRSTS